MEILIQFLSETLGISYATVEGSIATLAFLFCAFLLKLLWDASKRDNKQVDLEQTLAQLAVRSLNSYDASLQKLEDNTKAITRLGTILDKMEISFGTLATEVESLVGGVSAQAPILEEIKNNMFKTSKTTITIVDEEDKVLATIVAEPDGDGNLIVRITEEAKRILASKVNEKSEISTDDITEAAKKAASNIKKEIRTE